MHFFLKDKFGILHLKCFKIVSDEIESLRLKFGHMLLAREFSVSVVGQNYHETCSKATFAVIFM